MSQRGSFIDLRLNHHDQGEESFWPSFTDIMMVIVMIFLLAMVILITRNMELVSQLRSSLQAEQEASLQAQSASHQNSQLSQQLHAMEKELNMMRLKLMDLSDEHQQTLKQLQTAQTQNLQLRDHYTQLQQAQNNLQQQNAQLQQQQQHLDQQLLQANQDYLALQHQLQSKQQELLNIQQTHELDMETIQKLKATYAGLEKKYQRLIRPARSPKGRFVVQVRYQKINGVLHIDLKAPSDRTFTSVSGTEMHKRLSALQKQHPHDLYIKIIFPENSGLSYNEAWKMTESLLRMYDYYYQEQP